MIAQKLASAQSPLTSLPTPFLPQLAWPNAFEAWTQMGAEIASFTTERVQAQMRFMQELARCTDVSEFYKQQADFVRSTCESYAQEFSKLLELARRSGTLAANDITSGRSR
jgi:hypothetical protein